MSNVTCKKVFIQIESEQEQKEHIRNQRKTLKVLQGVASKQDKENLVGRPQLDRLSRVKTNLVDVKLDSSDATVNKRKKAENRSIETQTDFVEPENEKVSENIIDDLTTEAKPSGAYWERLAERRREALEESLSENQHLHERIEGLEDELNTTRQLLEESHGLVEILKQMMEESDDGENNESADDAESKD